MKTLVFLFSILVSTTIILAQDFISPDQQLATSPTTGILSNFPFKPPSFDFDALWPHFAASGFRLRHKRSFQENSELEDHSRAKRNVITCDYQTQGGFRCTGCKQVMRCYPFNMGTLTTCGGIFPYCNYGVCSSRKGSLCSSTTSTSATSSTSTDSSTSAATSTSTASSTSTSTALSTTTSNSAGSG